MCIKGWQRIYAKAKPSTDKEIEILLGVSCNGSKRMRHDGRLWITLYRSVSQSHRMKFVAQQWWKKNPEKIISLSLHQSFHHNPFQCVNVNFRFVLDFVNKITSILFPPFCARKDQLSPCGCSTSQILFCYEQHSSPSLTVAVLTVLKLDKRLQVHFQIEETTTETEQDKKSAKTTPLRVLEYATPQFDFFARVLSTEASQICSRWANISFQ